MRIIRSARQMQLYSTRLRQRRRKIGFVPTMGCLHEGHLSLVRRAAKENDVTIASIFVNPLQFGPGEDLKKYPRDFKGDEGMLRKAGCDLVFYPPVKELYPPPYRTYVNTEYLTDVLCGSSRPGHFRGVTTVVAKLFNIVKPDNAYFGQKDAQQAAVIAQMARDLNFDMDIKVLPTVREPDGLAMSSRNSYLSKDERSDAAVLYRSLSAARKLIKSGERSGRRVISKIKTMIRQKGSARIDYIEIVDAATLRAVKRIKGDILVALAIYIGKTRLIDNLRMRVR